MASAAGRDQATAPRGTLSFGVLGRAHGVRGELILRPFNPGGTDLRRLSLPVEVELVMVDRRQTATLVAARPFGDGEALVRLAGVDDRDAAAALTNAELLLPRAALPALAPDEMYIADLLGCEVRDGQGRLRGRVVSTFWNGSHDVLSIVGEEGAELLIPVVPGFIQAVDLAARTLVIDDHE
jgi:16S rRNA processing protein RimM